MEDQVEVSAISDGLKMALEGQIEHYPDLVNTAKIIVTDANNQSFRLVINKGEVLVEDGDGASDVEFHSDSVTLFRIVTRDLDPTQAAWDRSIKVGRGDWYDIAHWIKILQQRDYAY